MLRFPSRPTRAASVPDSLSAQAMTPLGGGLRLPFNGSAFLLGTTLISVGVGWSSVFTSSSWLSQADLRLLYEDTAYLIRPRRACQNRKLREVLRSRAKRSSRVANDKGTVMPKYRAKYEPLLLTLPSAAELRRD